MRVISLISVITYI